MQRSNFVPTPTLTCAEKLNPEYVEKPYFVTPGNDAQAEAYAVVRQALVNTGKAAIGKVSFAGRENIVALMPSDERGMMAYTLRYQTELRNHSDYFRDIKKTEVSAVCWSSPKP